MPGHQSGYDQSGYDQSGYDQSGYDQSGYDQSGRDQWRPLPRPPEPRQTVSVDRVPDPEAGRLDDAEIRRRLREAGGPEVLTRGDGTATVRFWYHDPGASAVALCASGWWRLPEPWLCDLRRAAGGPWWHLTVQVPDDWETTYRFAVHHGRQEPPWWTRGLRDPGSPTTADPHNPRGHTAARGDDGSVLWLPGAGHRPWLRAFGRGSSGGGAASSPPQRLAARGPDEPRTWWWAARGTGRLPLLVLFDGELHIGPLATHRVLAEAVSHGILPPLAAVFVESGPARGTSLGVPAGRSSWVGEALVPRLRREGLPGVAVTEDPRRTVVSGASLGGLSALFTVAGWPEAISCAVAQSVSWWRYPDGAFVEPLARLAGTGRVRLQAGSYEGTTPDRTRAVARALSELDVEVGMDLATGGHDWAWWVPRLVEATADLLGG